MMIHLGQFLCFKATIVVQLNQLWNILHHFGKSKENKNLMIIFIFKIKLRLFKIQIRSNKIRNNKIRLLKFHKNKLIHLDNIKRKQIYLLIKVPRSYLFIQVYLHYSEEYYQEQYVYFHAIAIKKLEICKAHKRSHKVMESVYRLLTSIINKFLKNNTLKLSLQLLIQKK